MKLDEKSILNLLIVQSSSGKLRWSSVISYLPEDGISQSQLSKKTVQNIINGEQVSDNGMFKFIDLKGNLQYQIEYRSGKLHSFGKPARQDLAQIKKSKSTAASEGCIDWYLVTTYYYSDGSTSVESEYLFTTCDQDSDGGGGGGDGGENPDPEEPNDQEITVSGSSNISESDYQPEDFELPVETDNPQEMDLDENGNPLPPVSNPSPLVYYHTWTYTYNALGPFYIKTVYMNDATVSPGNEQYQTSLGTMIRNVSLLNQRKTANEGSTTARLLWEYDVHYRWTNITTSVIKTMQRRKTHSKTIPF